MDLVASYLQRLYSGYRPINQKIPDRYLHENYDFDHDCRRAIACTVHPDLIPRQYLENASLDYATIDLHI